MNKKPTLAFGDAKNAMTMGVMKRISIDDCKITMPIGLGLKIWFAF